MAQQYPPTPSNMPVRIRSNSTTGMTKKQAKVEKKANARGLKAANKPGPLKVRTTGGLGGGLTGFGIDWQVK